ncbi:MAG: hypothetical protein KAJ23_08600, partial [Maribacter sp.]|nr:hypothetical protein [Maribacter sp.]
LDLHSLRSLVFENYTTQNLLQATRFYTTQVSTVNGTEISGYCFDEDKDMVWLEGTAQMALAYKMASDEHNADAIISELEKSFVNALFLPLPMAYHLLVTMAQTMAKKCYGTTQVLLRPFRPQPDISLQKMVLTLYHGAKKRDSLN